jgi:hypothetical protein
MIKHIVIWRLNNREHERDRDDTARAIAQQIDGMRGRIPGLRHIEGGVDFSRSADSCDVVLYAELDSRKALEDYQAHPVHEAFKAFLGPHRRERYLVDYEI